MADRPLFIATPYGNLVAMGSGGNPILDNVKNTVTWNGVVEPFPSLAAATTYYNQVKAAMVATTAPNAFIQDFSVSPVITDINPRNYSALNDGTFIQVIGYGFSPALNNSLLANDDGGHPLNGEGYVMNLTYINPNLMTAVWNSDGDGNLAAGPVAIYIITAVDGTIQSNVLPAYTLGNKEVNLY